MNENEFRAWVKQILGVLKTGAGLTPTLIDDQACEMVLKVVDSDILWGWVWKTVDQWVVDEDHPILVGAPEMVGVNPLLVLAVIKALLALWKALRPE